MKIAERAARALAVRDGEVVRPPGALRHLFVQERDGRQVLVVSKGDVFEIYIGRREPVALALSVSTARRLMRWLVWDWWIVGTWCGLRLWLWDRALARMMDAVAHEEAPTDVHRSDTRLAATSDADAKSGSLRTAQP